MDTQECKERPILFSGSMVRAILEGRKTQTRRVIKRPLKHPGWTSYVYYGPSKNDPTLKSHATECGPDYPDNDDDVVMCPYGSPGDRLWVRETWAKCGETQRAIYKADEVLAIGAYGVVRWRPPIFMSRWASRISLEITDIRVQRVQEISEGDAIEEGVGYGFQMNSGWPDYEHIKDGICELTQDTAQMSFASLWDSINKEHGFGWNVNPWVWVIEFKRKG